MKVICVISFAIFVTLVFGLGEPVKIESRIIGGHSASIGQFPYQVSLQTILFRRHFCAASIISQRFLLTAGHCIGGCELDNFVAIVGAVRRKFDGFAYKIQRVIRHEEFDTKTFRNDIALIFTVDEINFSLNIQPIALPRQNDSGNTLAVLSGWGKRNLKSVWPSARLLQYAEMYTISNDECFALFDGTSQREYLNENSSCAVQRPGVGACHGDSGGPLVDLQNGVLLGIVSWGVPCAIGYPDVFTRVYSYLDWIEGHMEVLMME